MGHYAKVVNGKVTKVIVAQATFFDNFVDDSPGKWIKTSYNTRGGIHYQPNSSTPSPTVFRDELLNDYATAEEAAEFGTGTITSIDLSKTLAIRGNYAGIGYTYDSTLDAFYPPKPFESWGLNTGSFTWEAPVAFPTGDATGSWTGSYVWDESSTNWVTGSI